VKNSGVNPQVLNNSAELQKYVKPDNPVD